MEDKKRGIFFSADALIALAIIIIIALIAFPIFEYSTIKTNIQQDTIVVLSSLKVGEFASTSSNVFDWINQGIINDTNKTLIEQMGIFYVENPGNAKVLAQDFLDSINTTENIGIWYNNTLLASKNNTSYEDATKVDVARQIISGISGLEGNSSTGFSARAYLQSGHLVKYTYFGGYVGDGNITVFLRDTKLPATDVRIEGAISNDFELYVNNESAGHFAKSSSEFKPSNYTIGKANFSISPWNTYEYYLSNPEGLYDMLEFRGNNLHIAGGFIKTEYSKFDVMSGPLRYYFPGIDGVINIYDGVYIPGNLNSMNIFLRINTNNYTSFLTIGNTTVYKGNTSGMQTILINNSQLLSYGLNYSQISGTTIPLRIGLDNVSTNNILDIALVNDRSGSMMQSGWTYDVSIPPSNVSYNFSVPKKNYSNNYSFNVPAGTTRLLVSIDWSKVPGYDGSEGSEFALNLMLPNGTWIFGNGNPTVLSGKVDPPSDVAGPDVFFSGISTKPQAVIVNNPVAGNWKVRVWGWNFRPSTAPPSFQNVTIFIYEGDSSQIIRDPTILSFDAAKNASENFVDSIDNSSDMVAYVVFGSYSMVLQNLTFSRALLKTAIDNTGLQGGTAIQEGIVNGTKELINNGRQNSTKILILLTDGQNDAGPQVVLDAANSSKNQGIIIFTIGLTTYVNHDLLKQVASDPSFYYYSPDGSGLNSIYNSISQKIISIYKEQTLNVTGNISTRLYPDSYIEFNYTKDPGDYGLLVSGENKFKDNLSGSFIIPNKSSIAEARVVSYSGPKWTDKVWINGNKTYDLSRYGNDYTKLGDPYAVNIPNSFIKVNETNNFVNLTVGISPTDFTNGSEFNKIIYTIAREFAAYSDVVPTIDGCVWNIQFEDDTNATIGAGSLKSCYFNSTAVIYDNKDASQAAVYNLFKQLDFNNNNKSDYKFSDQDLQIALNQITGIPFVESTEIQVRTWR